MNTHETRERGSAEYRPRHVPSPLYPVGWVSENPDDYWESPPCQWPEAVRAWAAAASSEAQPLTPPHVADLARAFGRMGPNAGELYDLVAEAIRRAEWLPLRQRHPVGLNTPEVWMHRKTFGLCWHSSVQTILANTAAGWVVRIIGGHRSRVAAACAALANDGILVKG